MRYMKWCLLAILVSVTLLQQNAHAYLDPSSGSILIQILLGGIAGFFVMLKIYWRRIKRFLSGKKSTVETPEQEVAANTND
jgi:hypothetical protein